jgi:hypothetical protein
VRHIDGVLPVRHIDGVLPVRHIDGVLPVRHIDRVLPVLHIDGVLPVRHIDGVLPTLAVLHPECDVVRDGRVLGLENGEVYASQPHLLLNLGTTVSQAVVSTQRHPFHNSGSAAG